MRPFGVSLTGGWRLLGTKQPNGKEAERMADLMREPPTYGSWAWLNDETWRWFTNVAEDADDQLAAMRARWGAENIDVREPAYDMDRNPVSGQAVFVRRSAWEARAGR